MSDFGNVISYYGKWFLDVWMKGEIKISHVNISGLNNLGSILTTDFTSVRGQQCSNEEPSRTLPLVFARGRWDRGSSSTFHGCSNSHLEEMSHFLPNE